VSSGSTGYVAGTNAEFIARVLELARDMELRKRMGVAARERVAGVSWDAAFEKTYLAYHACLPENSAVYASQKKVSIA